MTVDELKKMLSELPPHCGGFKVDFTARIEHKADNSLLREDHPVSCSIVDWQSQEVLLMGREQFQQLKDYAQ